MKKIVYQITKSSAHDQSNVDKSDISKHTKLCNESKTTRSIYYDFIN